MQRAKVETQGTLLDKDRYLFYHEDVQMQEHVARKIVESPMQRFSWLDVTQPEQPHPMRPAFSKCLD